MSEDDEAQIRLWADGLSALEDGVSVLLPIVGRPTARGQEGELEAQLCCWDESTDACPGLPPSLVARALRLLLEDKGEGPAPSPDAGPSR